MNRASWPSGSQSHGSAGIKNDCSRSHVRKFCGVPADARAQMRALLLRVWMRSSPPTPTRRLLGTTCGSADRSHADACFVLAEQASEKADQAHLVLVRSESLE